MSAAGPRQPVDRVLRHAGHGVVVLGRDEQQAVGRGDAVLQRLHDGGNALGRLEVAVVQRNAADRGDAQLDAGRHQLDRGAQQGAVERGLTQAAGQADEGGHSGGLRGLAAGRRLSRPGAGIRRRCDRNGSGHTTEPPEVPAHPARTRASRRQRVRSMRASIRPTTHVTSGSTRGERRRIESAHEAARPRCPRALGCSSALPAAAGPGDVYVPAHRTADGSWVPANVPPSSGGTRMARKLPVRAAKPPACDGDLAGIADRAAAVRRRRADPPLGRVRAPLPAAAEPALCRLGSRSLALSVDAQRARPNLQWRSTRARTAPPCNRHFPIRLHRLRASTPASRSSPRSRSGS